MATATQQRSREIGIGMATRAGGRMIRGKVLRDGVRVVGPVIRIETAVSAWLAGRSR